MPDPYRHAHWFFLAALAAIIAGFWPSFFLPMSGGSLWHTVHGITATSWIVLLVVQSWLAATGRKAQHRAFAAIALLLVPTMSVSALYMVAVMMVNPNMPPGLAPILAFIDIPSIAFFLFLVSAAIATRRKPVIHKRYMTATVFLAFPPALTRLYARLLSDHIDFMTALHASFMTVHVLLLALIVSDWRRGKWYLPYPLALGFFIFVQVLMGPIGTSDAWQQLMLGMSR